MTNLNVTEGDWFVEYGNLLVVGDVRYEMLNEHDAHLFAQAKNMYEMIDSLSTELLHMIRKENARLIQNASCIDLDEPDYLDEESVYLARKLMDACKPPEE